MTSERPYDIPDRQLAMRTTAAILAADLKFGQNTCFFPPNPVNSSPKEGIQGRH